jgi:hypothetical protein
MLNKWHPQTIKKTNKLETETNNTHLLVYVHPHLTEDLFIL